MTSDVEVASAMRAARRGYELGRARTAIVRAAIATTAVASIALALVGARSLPWLVATFAAMALAEWRGGVMGLGARRGVMAGAATLLLPLSILRPCCATDVPMDGVSCCTMPEACVASGAIVGLALALLLPRLAGASAARRAEAAFGMALGVVSVATIRCAPLFLGEAAGLLGGLVAGVVAATVAGALVERRRAREGR
jgi:hypothetical protein